MNLQASASTCNSEPEGSTVACAGCVKSTLEEAPHVRGRFRHAPTGVDGPVGGQAPTHDAPAPIIAS